MSDTLAVAARVLRDGGCLVYPTETFFALGALAVSASALARIAAIKARPASKPLPLLVGELSHMTAILPDGFAAGPLGPDFDDLAGRFWPGPLSLVVPCRESLPAMVKDGQGRVSVRLTPHPTAAALCRLAGGPLVATSANRSGFPPAAAPEELDPEVLAAADGVVFSGPPPAGGPASTVAAMLGGRRLLVFRQGAVAVEALRLAGYAVALRQA